MLQDAKGGDGDSVAGAVVPMFAVARKMPERKKKKRIRKVRVSDSGVADSRTYG